MQKVKIYNSEVQELITGEAMQFPRYTTQLMNLANQNAQGTRPRVVGQMSDLIQEFSGRSIAEWDAWYKERHPDAIDDATERVYAMVEHLRDAIQHVDKAMVRKWAEDLIITKTFVGLRFQEAILKKVADLKGMTYRLASPEEESQSIDGHIGYIPVSIKPVTYKGKGGLVEEISVHFIFYEKKKDGIVITFDF